MKNFLTQKIKTFVLLIMFLFLMALPAVASDVELPPSVAPKKGGHAPVDFQHQGTPGKVVVVLADRTSIDDWMNMDTTHLSWLARNYATGLMNCQTGGGKIPENTLLTIGAGVPLLATGTAGSAHSSEEELPAGKVMDLYRQGTGEYPPAGSIAYIEIPKVFYLNEESPYLFKPGTLGRILHENNMKTAVLGNSDLHSALGRQAVLLAMDERGIVDAGNTGAGTLLKDPGFPGGIRTNYENLISNFLSLPEGTRLVVIDLGDFTRLEDARQNVFPPLITTLREQSMQRLDVFLGQMMKHMDLDSDLLAIISPTPGGITAGGENMLTPFLLAGNGIPKGLVYSISTKRPGIIRNTDLLPTIFNFLDIDPPIGMTGQILKVMPGEYSTKSIASLHANLALTNKLRQPILQGYVLIQLLLLGASLLFIFWKKPLARVVLRPLMLGVMSFPVAALLLPFLPNSSTAYIITGITILIVALTYIFTRSGKLGDLAPFILISGLTSILIVIDLFLGAPLQKNSLLGYHPVVGARFYGLGNEYMGILISSTIIAISSFITQFTKHKRVLLPVLSLYFILTIYVIASPNFGTNVGGTISSVGAFLVTMLLLFGVHIRPKAIVFICTGIFTVITGFIIYDLHQPLAQQSHIGRTASLILAGGWSEMTNIISRKLAMNVKLIRYTIWSRVFIASLGYFALLFYRPSGIMRVLYRKYPPFYKGLAGVVVGSILALIFNDSGIVAAATAMIFAIYPMIYLTLQEISQKDN